MTSEPAISEASVGERALRVAIALSAEVIVMRQRLEIVERLAAERGLFGPGDIDAYARSPEDGIAAKTERLRFLKRVLGTL